MKLVPTEDVHLASEELNVADLVKVGQWYWVKGWEDGKDWLGCVTGIGSNYVLLNSPHNSFDRIHFDVFFERIDRREYDPDSIIKSAVGRCQTRVKSLLDDIKQLTAKLGLTPAGELPEPGSQSSALVVAHKTKNIEAHKKALIKAKEKTLPDLFNKVKKEHSEMATWLKASLIPMKAEASILQDSVKCIEDRIFTVELYAGLCEELTQIRDGEPGGNDEKVHVFQRRHYMDEECLVNYSSGGMEFKDIKDFDKWLMKKANRERILPMPKCVVSFQVRRKQKEREAACMTDFISFSHLSEYDKETFLYIRNGDQYFRLSTSVEFGGQLFPEEEKSGLFHGPIYIEETFYPSVISEKEYLNNQERNANEKAEHEQKLKKWNRTSKAKRVGHFAPHYWAPHDRYVPLTPGTVYYDDGMAIVNSAARDHNRIATVLQGLLDRSPAFHPHPPWRLWTAEGFSRGIELVYDDSRGITVGDPPDFKTYRDRLNESIVIGTHTVGQYQAWQRAEAKKENDRQNNDYRIREVIRFVHYVPYGNPGPANVDIVSSVGRGKKHCVFKWERERLRPKWVSNPDRPGWQMIDESGIGTQFRCPRSSLLNIDAYTPGDYKQFYEDPRTRADYLKWAPLLLAAEDFHAKK